MHCLIALLYGINFWLALLALATITEPGLILLTAASAPIVIGAAMVVLFVLDAALARVWG